MGPNWLNQWSVFKILFIFQVNESEKYYCDSRNKTFKSLGGLKKHTNAKHKVDKELTTDTSGEENSDDDDEIRASISKFGSDIVYEEVLFEIFK